MAHDPRSAAVTLFVLLLGSIEAQEAAELPIREITLYRSGVGAFSRIGRIVGDASAQLKFPTDDVNDILKSMTILDYGGGSIGPVSYGSKEPLARRLASFGVDISKAPSVPELFTQLRGASLRVVTLDGPTEGTILGVENRAVVARAGGRGTVVTRPHVNLLTERGVRSISIADVASFDLLDPALAEELQLALGALAEQREERIKTVDLTFLGSGDVARDVVVSYVREMPVWKASYRLILAGREDPPTIQGFAIVENTTDDEWTGVRLSLASGRPVGFTMDLYQPIYAARPDVPVPMDGGLAPTLYESGPRKFGGRAKPGHVATSPPALASARFRKSADHLEAGEEEEEVEETEDDADFAFDSYAVTADHLGDAHASGDEVGGQFHFTVDTPVTLARQRSAMLPILLAKIDGRRVSILTVDDPTRAPDHPMQGVELRNDTALHLMPGPIAVYDGGAYAGDAQIDHTARNQRRLLAFAMDIDVECRTRATFEQTLVGMRITAGAMVRSTRQRSERTYRLINFDESSGRTVLVEYPRNESWTLVEPDRPTEMTDAQYRFEVELPAGGDVERTIIEERVTEEHLGVTSVSLESLLEFRSDGKVSDAVVAAVKRAAELMSTANELRQGLIRLNQERRAIGDEQARIRENLTRVPANSDLHRRYVEKLTAQEDRLDALIGARRAQETAHTDARSRFDEYLRDLDVD